jgi:hypothetical protein
MPLCAGSSVRSLAFLSPWSSVSGVVISTTIAVHRICETGAHERDPCSRQPRRRAAGDNRTSIRDLDAAADHLSDSPVASAARGKSRYGCWSLRISGIISSQPVSAVNSCDAPRPLSSAASGWSPAMTFAMARASAGTLLSYVRGSSSDHFHLPMGARRHC